MNEVQTLSENMKRVAEFLALQSVQEEKLTMGEVADKFGISRKTLYTWRMSPVFIQYQNAVSQKVMESHISEINNRILELIHSKNENVSLKAIELHAKLMGRLQAAPQINILDVQPKTDLLDDIQALERRIARAKAGEPIDVIIEE